MKIEDLEFGVNVFQNDNIHYDESDSLRQINHEGDLEYIKSKLLENYGNVEVIINRDEIWSKVFTIPSLKEDHLKYCSEKAKALASMGTTE
jgi:hypothetical protein